MQRSVTSEHYRLQFSNVLTAGAALCAAMFILISTKAAGQGESTFWINNPSPNSLTYFERAEAYLGRGCDPIGGDIRLRPTPLKPNLPISPSVPKVTFTETSKNERSSNAEEYSLNLLTKAKAEADILDIVSASGD